MTQPRHHTDGTDMAKNSPDTKIEPVKSAQIGSRGSTTDNSELRDAITALVFDWQQEVSKFPRGKTISFWHDEKVMELIEAWAARRTIQALERLKADIYMDKYPMNEVDDVRNFTKQDIIEDIDAEIKRLKRTQDNP